MSSTEKTVAQLFPPKIHLQTKPIVGADIGVPLHAVIIYPPELVFKRAQLHIDPPLSGTVEEGDNVRLYATLDPALVGTVTDAEFADSTAAPLLLDATTIQKDVNAPIRMYLKESQFLYDVVVYLFYTITRVGENVGVSTSISYIWNRIRPGMKDDVTVPGGHAKLKLLLPDAIKDGIGPDFVTARVAVQYPYCRAYDRISFMCNGKILEINVGPTEAPEPPDHGSETPTTIYFDVDRAFLELAKQQDKKMAFLFTVYDQLNNSADPDAQWSPPQIVDEDLDGTRFAKPILREQLNDPSDTPEINLGKLKDQPLKIVIVPTDPRFKAGHRVTTFYTATHPDHPDVVDERTGTVVVDEFGQKQLVVIEVPNEKVIIAGSTVKVFYEVREPDKGDGSPGDLVGKSNTTVAQVVGVHLELKAPGVLQAKDTTLAPTDALDSLTVVADYAQQPDDFLSIEWKADPDIHPEGSIVTTPRPVSEIGLRVDIPPRLMAFCLGNKARVRYFITRNGEQLSSETLTLNVLDLPQSALIAPRLKEADDDGEGTELKLTNVTPEGKMWCPGFPLIAEGQYVWLLFKGTNADGSPYEKYIWAAPFAFVNEQWVKDGFFEAFAPYGDLIGLMPGRPLTMVMFIAFGKSQDLALAKRFMERTYTVSAVEDVAPTIDLIVATDNGEEIAEGATTVKTAVTLSGTGAKGQKVEVFDNGKSIDTPLVDGAGEWTLPVSGLALTLHKFTVAQIGSEERSEERTLTVTELVTPTLTSVKDSNDVEVPDGTYTVSTSLTVSGKASKGQEVEIFEGTAADVEPKGKALADLVTGDWQRTISVALGPRRLFARSLYHSGEVDSEARSFTVTADVAPTIDLIVSTDNGEEISEGATTVKTAVTLSGTGAKGQKVEVFDNGKSLDTPLVDSAGEWTLPVSALALSLHKFTVARIGSEERSEERTLTVTELVTPTLTSVKDSNDVEVPDGTYTVSTSLTVSGKASKGQEVEIFEGTASDVEPKGKAVADLVTGDWQRPISVDLGARRLFARSLYHSGEVDSEARSFTVTADVAPTIDSVKGSPSGVEIPEGGSTSDTSVTVTGKAANGLKVNVLDGASSIADPITNRENGVWTVTATFGVGSHELTAEALYGSGQKSAVRKFNVVAALTIDQSVMNLDAVKYVQSYGWGTKEVPGNVLTRQAKGGNPPYSYQSDNPAVASVTAGKVSGLKNGTTTIRVRDASGASVSFSVNVKNVYRITKGSTTYSGEAGSIAAQQWIRSQGGLDLLHIYLNAATLNANFTNVLGDLLEGIQLGSPLASWMYTYHPYMSAYESSYVSWSNGISIHTGVLVSPFRALFVVPT
ncbi:hypothetical protein [Pseudomonas fluorescens]|uniref:hypothetical protein n=1 Tax=Pseudomonas fluorescens TaxID=294 RepID=UPI0006904055|nr:hypothetical protein [Pseudomonas fluorescens]